MNEKLNKRKTELEAEIKKYQSKCHKGFVYQVETGEGKSCIIAIIAAILALNGRTVHITSSNIKLANRDYMNSYEFFRLLKLKSAVLLHENELPNSKEKLNTSANNEDGKKEHPPLSPASSDLNKSTKDVKKEEDDDEYDYFKDNYKSYYDYHTQEKAEFNKYYGGNNAEYYKPEQFKNSSRMNFGVCGLDANNQITSNRPNIIFSTFVNFECFYLKMMELCPAYIPLYYKKCALLIDEADSILIDEISNGTIVSREMKSNTKEILQYVYNKRNKYSANKMYKKIKRKWKKCVDLNEQDVVKMYSEIDLVNEDEEFRNGRKYMIKENEVKNNKKKKKLIRQSLNLAKDILFAVGKGLYNEFSKKDGEKEEEDDDDEDEEDDDDNDDDDDEEEEEKLDLNKCDDNEEEDSDDEFEEEEIAEKDDSDDDDKPVTVFREIIPFDYDHKGIPEPNKEFGGFIQQFIAIKESKKKENKNMIIKDMTMSYLYVSHPIFVKLYSSVCGFTGTIGTHKDKKIYKEHYDLETLKVPRHQANHRVEFPIILCETIKERNKKIVNEVIEFHKRGNPVLVIFQDLKEIETVSYMLNSKGIKYINIFDGKNDDITPDYIAGIRGDVSLGTNVCGRGTNIIARKEPLHVIISYYTSNARVMNQARGRTARQGSKGTTRVICLKDQYLYAPEFDQSGIESAIGEFEVKNEIQSEFIKYYIVTKPWIFEHTMKKPNLTTDQIEKMREARINVNRIVAYNFEFPLKMSVVTFLKIQTQKIFSLLNCPNCVHSWMLFQKYIREMILESWSLTINAFDEEFFDREENYEYKLKLTELNNIGQFSFTDEYQEMRENINIMFRKNICQYYDELSKKKSELINQLTEFLPLEISDVVPTFMHIFTKVIVNYQSNILNSFKSMSNAYIQLNKKGFISFQAGFKPYSLLTDSGARVSFKNYHKTNYIKDPELKYMKKLPNNKISWLSITEKIDDLFNLIFQQINKIIGDNTFLRFFMRRTLCGCEFGLCMNLPTINNGFNDPNCLIDKDPLFIFTINVRSVIPILAGVLIVLLVYAASMSNDIAQWFYAFPKKFTEEALKRAATVIVSVAAPKLVHFALDKFIKFLKKLLKKQIKELKKKKSDLATISVTIIESLLHIFSSSTGEKINAKISKLLGDKIKVTMNWQKLIKNCLDPARIMKISFLLLLCLATFILNFNTRKDEIKNDNKNDKEAETDDAINHEKADAKEYEKAFKKREKLQIIEERDEAKVNEVIENLRKKNENVLDNNKDLVDDFEENAFSDDEDEKNLSKEEKQAIEKEIISEIEIKSEEIKHSYLFKFNSVKTLDVVKKITNFTDKQLDKIEKIEKMSNGIATIQRVFKNGKDEKKKYLRMRYKGLKKPFVQQMTVYITNAFPSILEIIGYNARKKQQDLFVASKENGSLESYIKNQNHVKIPPTEKLIIAYGIARAMEFLHSHKIVHRNLKPVNIMLDSKFYPFLSEFYLAKQTETKLNYCLQNMTPGFMPPEFLLDYKANQDSFKIDVYSYGVTLFILLNEKNPFDNLDFPKIISDTLNGVRPTFPDDFDQNWKNLIESCWRQNPDERPSFRKIRKKLESEIFTGQSVILTAFNKYKELFKKMKK